MEKAPNSSFSHSACQIVLEEKAESLKAKRSRLADPCLSHNDNNNSNTKSLFPMEPHRRGVTSGGTSSQVFHGKTNSNSKNNKLGSHGRKRNHGRRRTTRKNDESNETQTIYWVMPSYTQPFKKEIMQILNREKMNLCKNKTFEKVFSNISFKIAYTNIKNIKQLIVRTKVKLYLTEHLLLGFIYAHTGRLTYVVMETN